MASTSGLSTDDEVVDEEVADEESSDDESNEDEFVSSNEYEDQRSKDKLGTGAGSEVSGSEKDKVLKSDSDDSKKIRGSSDHPSASVHVSQTLTSLPASTGGTMTLLPVFKSDEASGLSGANSSEDTTDKMVAETVLQLPLNPISGTVGIEAESLGQPVKLGSSDRSVREKKITGGPVTSSDEKPYNRSGERRRRIRDVPKSSSKVQPFSSDESSSHDRRDVRRYRERRQRRQTKQTREPQQEQQKTVQPPSMSGLKAVWEKMYEINYMLSFRNPQKWTMYFNAMNLNISFKDTDGLYSDAIKWIPSFGSAPNDGGAVQSTFSANMRMFSDKCRGFLTSNDTEAFFNCVHGNEPVILHAGTTQLGKLRKPAPIVFNDMHNALQAVDEMVYHDGLCMDIENSLMSMSMVDTNASPSDGRAASTSMLFNFDMNLELHDLPASPRTPFSDPCGLESRCKPNNLETVALGPVWSSRIADSEIYDVDGNEMARHLLLHETDTSHIWRVEPVNLFQSWVIEFQVKLEWMLQCKVPVYASVSLESRAGFAFVWRQAEESTPQDKVDFASFSGKSDYGYVGMTGSVAVVFDPVNDEIMLVRNGTTSTNIRKKYGAFPPNLGSSDWITIQLAYRPSRRQLVVAVKRSNGSPNSPLPYTTVFPVDLSRSLHDKSHAYVGLTGTSVGCFSMQYRSWQLQRILPELSQSKLFFFDWKAPKPGETGEFLLQLRESYGQKKDSAREMTHEESFCALRETIVSLSPHPLKVELRRIQSPPIPKSEKSSKAFDVFDYAKGLRESPDPRKYLARHLPLKSSKKTPRDPNRRLTKREQRKIDRKRTLRHVKRERRLLKEKRKAQKLAASVSGHPQPSSDWDSDFSDDGKASTLPSAAEASSNEDSEYYSDTDDFKHMAIFKIDESESDMPFYSDDDAKRESAKDDSEDDTATEDDDEKAGSMIDDGLINGGTEYFDDDYFIDYQDDDERAVTATTVPLTNGGSNADAVRRANEQPTFSPSSPSIIIPKVTQQPEQSIYKITYTPLRPGRYIVMLAFQDDTVYYDDSGNKLKWVPLMDYQIYVPNVY